jgi:hypothetical protein
LTKIYKIKKPHIHSKWNDEGEKKKKRVLKKLHMMLLPLPKKKWYNLRSHKMMEICQIK